MAKYEDGSYGSAAGIALIAKVLAGRCAMKYTRVAVGKGNIPDDKTPKTMTEPADYVMDAVIAGITNPVDGECQVTVQINSANVDKGFYCTAVVLYAEDPDEGEVPYTYLVLENEPEWIRPASSIVGKLATIDLIAAVGDVDTVTAEIDPEAIATVAAVNDLIKQHNEDPNAHASVIEAAASAAVKRVEESGQIMTEAQVKKLIQTHSGSGYFGEYSLVLRAAGWTPLPDTGPYQYIYDAALADSDSSLIPSGGTDVNDFAVTARAGVLNTCETRDGSVRFFSQRVPDADIHVTLTLNGSGKGGGTNASGNVTIGQGLKRDETGAIAVSIGDGLAFDATDALTVRKDTVVTSDDLVNDEKLSQEIAEILK